MWDLFEVFLTLVLGVALTFVRAWVTPAWLKNTAFVLGALVALGIGTNGYYGWWPSIPTNQTQVLTGFSFCLFFALVTGLVGSAIGILLVNKVEGRIGV